MGVRSRPEARFEQALNLMSALASWLPDWEREYRFHPKRKWRFDFAWPKAMVAVEVEGVVWRGKGRHQTASGLQGDCEKYAEALTMGWKVLRVTPQQVDGGEAMRWLRATLEPKED